MNYEFPIQFILRYFIPFWLIVIVSSFNYSYSQVSSGSQKMVWFVYIYFLTYNQIDPNVFSCCYTRMQKMVIFPHILIFVTFKYLPGQSLNGNTKN